MKYELGHVTSPNFWVLSCYQIPYLKRILWTKFSLEKFFRPTKFSSPGQYFVNFVQRISLSDEFLSKTLLRRTSHVCHVCSILDKNQQRRRRNFLTRDTCWNISVITLVKTFLKRPTSKVATIYAISLRLFYQDRTALYFHKLKA